MLLELVGTRQYKAGLAKHDPHRVRASASDMPGVQNAALQKLCRSLRAAAPPAATPVPLEPAGPPTPQWGLPGDAEPGFVGGREEVHSSVSGGAPISAGHGGAHAGGCIREGALIPTSCSAHGAGPGRSSAEDEVGGPGPAMDSGTRADACERGLEPGRGAANDPDASSAPGLSRSVSAAGVQ